MKLNRISIPIAFDPMFGKTDKFLRYLQEICEIFELQIVGLVPVSSSGAWPEVTFRGESENLEKFIMSFYFDDPEEGADFFESYLKDDEPGDFFVESDHRFTSRGSREFFTEEGEPKF